MQKQLSLLTRAVDELKDVSAYTRREEWINHSSQIILTHG